MTENYIVMLSADKLRAHPDNPRKDLGDLSELSESIKVNSIMQNLTVVPSEEAGGTAEDKPYTVIIGHRRLAAAKLAGVREVPCAIAHMDRKKQLSVMIAENVQRNELTILEQAKGFQMMFDEGASIGEISETSGFNKNTVKRRLEIAKLDEGKIREREESGVQLSLADFAKLEVLDRVEDRNELIEAIGTDNFRWKLRNAEIKQKMQHIEQSAIDVLNEFAVKAGSYSDVYSSGCDTEVWLKLQTVIDAKGLVVPPEDAGDKNVKYMYYPNNGEITIFRLVKKKKEPKKDVDEKKKETKRKISKIGELLRVAYDCRIEFIKNLDIRGIKTQERIKFVTMCLLCTDFMHGDVGVLRDIGLIGEGAYSISDAARVQILGNHDAEWSDMIKIAYAVTGDSPQLRTTLNGSMSAKYCGSGYECMQLRRVYDALSVIGYKVSDDERKLMDGTHNVYEK